MALLRNVSKQMSDMSSAIKSVLFKMASNNFLSYCKAFGGSETIPAREQPILLVFQCHANFRAMMSPQCFPIGTN